MCIMGVHQENFGCIKRVHQEDCALRGCIKRVHQLCLVHQEGASRGMCVWVVRQESFLILCDALRACTAKRGTLLKIKKKHFDPDMYIPAPF